MQIWMWLLAAGAHGMGFGVEVQGVVFGVGAAGALLFLRPIALRHLKKSSANQATNVDALIGATALALSVVTQNEGLIKLNGETCRARSHTGHIQNALQVKVVAIEGATAVVKQKG